MFKKISLVALLAVVAFGFATTAKAATAEELQAQITALMAQIAQLQGGSSTSAGCYAFTRDLTEGASGADVTALQGYLASKGMFSATATGFFGPITKAAVAAWQTANGVMPAAGYFGALSRAKYNMLCTPVASDDDDDDDTTVSGDLEGGAGSVDTYTLLTGLNNEEVGEDEEDVEVAGLEIETDDGSDLEFTAVRLVFNEGSADQDFEDYANEVSIWLDGEEFARVDGDEFTDDNDWTKTVSLDGGAIIRAGETGELVVAVSGVGNLDSGDDGETWDVDFRQVRFADADGGLISEDPTVAARTFSFETFAAAADVELKASLEDEEINDARVINVDATDDTDNVELLSFNLEVEGSSDILIDEIPVNLDVVTAANVDDVISDLVLFADGEEIGSENIGAGVGADETITFTDLDYTISAGDEIEFVVKANFLSIADALNAGDTIRAQMTATEVDLIDAEDESGENLVAADLTGTAVAEFHEVRDIGFSFELVSATATNQTAADATVNDLATAVIVFKLTAFDGDVSIDRSCEEGGGDAADQGVEWIVSNAGSNTPTCNMASTAGDNPDDTGASWLLEDGEEETFTLTVTNSTITADHFFDVYLESINWDDDSTDTSPDLYSTFGLGEEDTKTNTVFTNFNA